MQETSIRLAPCVLLACLSCSQPTTPAKPTKPLATNNPRNAETSQEAPEAQHIVRFTHTFSDGGSGGITTARTEGQRYTGLDGDAFSSSTISETAETEVNFQFRLAKASDGVDTYEITRTVTQTKKPNAFVGTSTQSSPVITTVDYAGEDLIVFDDEHGTSVLTSTKEPDKNNE